MRPTSRPVGRTLAVRHAVIRAVRKRDTRRKIILGGAVLAAVLHEGVPALRTADELHRWLDAQLQRTADRAVFGLTVDADET